jgi:hypothetical protein
MIAGERNRGLQDTATKELEGRHLDDDQSGSNSLDKAKKQVSDRRMRKATTRREPANELQARQRAIGQQLQRMFDAVANEPVPAEMLDLLRRIETQQTD